MSDLVKQQLDGLYSLIAGGADQNLIDVWVAGLTTEQAALVAIAARQKRLEMEKQMETMLAPLARITGIMEQRFLTEMNASGETNRSGAGWRATKTVQHNATLPDAGAFYEFLKQTARYDMLQRRLSSTVIKDYFDETGTLPPGVSMTPTNRVTFYRK